MKTAILAVMILMMIAAVPAFAGDDGSYEPEGGISAPPPATDAPGTPPAPALPPQAGTQSQYVYPPTGAMIPPIIVNVPPAPMYPPSYGYPQHEEKNGGLSGTQILLINIGVFLVLGIIGMMIWRNATANNGAGGTNGAREALPYGTMVQTVGMMEGATSGLAISPAGGMTYVQGTRPTGSAVMPAQNGGTAPAPPAPTVAQRTAGIAALTAAGIAAPTRRQQELAAEYVRDNFPGRRLNQATINAAIAAEIAAGNI